VLEIKTQYIGTINENVLKRVSWIVNATTEGSFSVTVNANSSGQGTDSESSAAFTTYKQFAQASLAGSATELNPNQEIVQGVSCYVGDYRIASIRALWNTSEKTAVRVYVYNSTGWKEILHSHNVSGTETYSVPVLRGQIAANESGECAVKIVNIGTGRINITSASLEAYYTSTVKVLDIKTTVNGIETTGIEPEDSLFNVTVNVSNPTASDYVSNINLSITAPDGSIANSSIVSNLNISASLSVKINFTNININNWRRGLIF